MKIMEKRVENTYSPSLLRPKMKTSPRTAATGRATVGNSGIFNVAVSLIC